MKHLIKVMLVSLVLSFAVSCAFAWENDLDQAIVNAKANGKLLFIMYGREACGNCQHLREMIKEEKVKLSGSEFIVLDLNCDNEKEGVSFQKKYSSIGGGYLPFVVIAKPDGTMIVSRKGYGEAADYQNLIQDAKKKYGE